MIDLTFMNLRYMEPLGLSEALHGELAPFNILVLIVEPGAFKTNIINSSNIIPASEPYRGTPATFLLDAMEKYRVEETQAGDTAKAAKIIFESVALEPASRLIGQVMRLPLGSDASTMLDKKIEMLKADYEKTKVLAKSTDRDEL